MTTFDQELVVGAGEPAEGPPAKPRVWTVFTAVALSLVVASMFQVVGASVFVAWELAQGGDLKQLADDLPKLMASPGVFILMAGCAQLSFGLFAVVPAWLSPVPLRERLGILPVCTSRAIYPLAMIGAMFPLMIGFGLAHALTFLLPADPSVAQLLENVTLGWTVPFILFLATVPAVAEELLFRGYVQRRLLERWGPGWAIGVTATMFALMHVSPLAVVALFPLSVWLGVVAWRSGSILPGMLCHAFVNGGVNAWRAVVKFGEISDMAQIVSMAAMLLLSAVCFGWSLRCFRRVAVPPVAPVDPRLEPATT